MRKDKSFTAPTTNQNKTVRQGRSSEWTRERRLLKVLYMSTLCELVGETLVSNELHQQGHHLGTCAWRSLCRSAFLLHPRFPR